VAMFSIKYRRINFLILSVLQEEYPSWVDNVVIRGLLTMRGYDLEREELERQLSYLEEKGFAKVMRPAENIAHSQITAAGLDKLEELEGEIL